MKKFLLILILFSLNSCSNEHDKSLIICYDYLVEYDPAFNKFYIWSCHSFGKTLEIGYGSFQNEDAAITAVRKIRNDNLNPKKQHRFIQIPNF